MNKLYIEYDKSGLITSHVEADEEAYNFLVKSGKHLLETKERYSYATHYVKNNEVLERPLQATKLEGSTLKNLPKPCDILIENQMYKCTDGIAELEFDQPMTYHIIVMAFPFKDFEVTYENQA